MTPELASPSSNYHTTSMEGRLRCRQILRLSLTNQYESVIGNVPRYFELLSREEDKATVSKVVKVSDRGLPCHEFEPSTTKDPPCRGAMHVTSVESSNVLPLMW
ncbi:hypothetical protein TNCV_3826361 [Trichonephila clavipes]|nr:hypothetical protein TNCV_3826361 [Trichonephila clavipes]